MKNKKRIEVLEKENRQLRGMADCLNIYFEKNKSHIIKTCKKYSKQDRHHKVHCDKCPYGCQEIYSCLFTHQLTALSEDEKMV